MSTTPKLGDSFSIDSSENTYAPGIAICRESASGGAINNQEIQDGTEVTISIAGSGAQPGDVLRVFIDDVLVAEHVLDASEISNSGGTTTGTGIAKVTISADVLKALAQGGHIVTSQIAYSDSTLSGVSPAKGTLIIDTIGPDAPVAPTATDDVGQTVGVIPEAATTDDANPIFSGTIAAKYNTIEVFDNGVSLGKATVNSITGKWTLTPLTALTDGPHAITVVEYDRAGNPSPTSAAMNFIVDTGPANVAITKVTDNVGDIQGDVATGGVTDDTTPTLVGTAKANTVVTISEGTTVLGTTTADALGHWEFTPAAAQNQGAHTYTASITVAGNTTTSTNFVVTVDTTGPAVVVTPLGDNLKTAAEATAATGVMTVNSEANAVSTVTFVGQNGQVVKTITNNGTAKPVVLTAADLITLGDGAVEVTTVTKDKAGNVTTTTDSADGDFTIDTVAALAVADVVNTTEDVISTTGNVGTNDTSKDGSESYSLIGSATGVYGTLALGSNGAYTYTRTANLDAIQITATDTFTYQVRDAAGNTTQSTLKINMAPVNDAAVISGVNTGSITESNAAQAVTGTLTIMDVDSSATFVVQTNVTGTNGYGKFSLNSAGVWTYTMNTAHDEFVAGTAYTDSFTATSADGTTKLITVTINGTNDAAVIGGTTTATLTQNATAQSATGTLSITDVDSATTFTALTDVAGSNGYGKFSLTSAGVWTYTMNTAHAEFVAGTAYTDSVTVTSADGTTKVVTVTINGTNDAAVIGGVSTATLTETNAAQSATGTLTISDADSATTFAVQSNVAGSNGYGKFSLTAAGVWTYTMNTAHDEFVAGTAYTDSFTATSADGTTKLITVTINGTNDAAVIGGVSTATLTETNAAQSATGTLTITDVDSATTFVAQTATAGSNGYGKFSLTAAGVWTYTMNTAHDEFVVGTVYTDSFTATSADGTTKLITVSINGTNDAAVIGGTTTATLTQNATAQSATGTLSITDVDSATTFTALTNVAGSNGYGKFSLTSGGVWTYAMNTAHAEFVAGMVYTDSTTVTSADGTTKLITVTINGTNDAATIGGVSTATLTETNAAQTATGTLTITDVDNATTFVAQTATAGSNGYGKFSLTAAGVWTYTMNTAHDEFVAGVNYTDSFTATSADGTTKLVTVTMRGTNDQPTFTSSATIALSATEDTAYNFVIANSLVGKVTDVDAGASVKGIAISWNQAPIDQGVWEWSTDGTTWAAVPADITGVATTFNNPANALYLNASDRLRFTPAANWNGNVNALVFRVADDTMPATVSGTRLNVSSYNGSTGPMSLSPSSYTLNVSGVNDAPVIVTTANSITTLEDTATTFVIGTQLNGKVTDVDGTALKGIVIVQNTTTSGTWAYSTDGGTTWVDFPTTYLGSVDWTKVMYLNATDSLRYTPAANTSGANLSDLNFRAVDASFPNTASGTQVSVISSIGGSGSVSGQAGHFTVSVTAVNDAPIGTNDTASATEASGVSNATAGSNPSGNVLTNDTDQDNATSTLVIKDILKGTTGTATAVAASTTSANGTSIVGAYGTLVIGADGSYTYSVNQSNATVQALNTTSAPLSDVFTYTVKDPSGLTGTATITVSVNGANDAAVIGGVSTATLTETNAAQTATGTLTITDVDSATTFAAQTNVAGSNGYGYGKFSLTTAGAWTYTMNTAHDEFVAGTAYTDSFTAVSADGTTKLVTVTINGTNDAAVVTPNVTARSYTENAAAIIANNNLTLVDAENTNLVGATVQITSGLTAGDTLAFTAGSGITGTYDAATGKLSLAGSATVLQYQTALQSVVYSSTSDNPTASSASRTLSWQVNDGASANNLSNLGSSTINVVAVNDAAVIGGTATASLTETNVAQTASGTLTITDVDSAATFVAQTNVAGSNGYGKFSVTSAGVWTYTMNTAHDEFLVGQVYTDSITVASADGTTKLVTVSITGSNHAPTLSYVDTGSSSTDAITNNPAMSVSSLEAAATWEYQVDNGAWTVGTGTTFTMSEGQHTYNVRQKDVLNHVSASASKTVTLDTVAPNAAGITLASDAGISNTDGVTNNGTLNIALSSDTNNWQYTTNGGTTWSNGTGTTLGLAAGTYAANSVQVQAFDKAGNATLSKYASAVTVDTSAPTVSVAIGNSSLQYGQSTTVSFNFSEAVYGFANSDVSVSGGSLSNITGSGRSYSATYTAGYSYNGGSYVSVNANTYTDQAGNNGGSGSTGSFSVGINVADVARGMSLYVTGYGHGWCDTQGWIGVGLWGNNDLQGATVTLYDGWGHSWSSNVAGSGGSTNFGTFSGGGNNVTKFHADISYGGQTASVGGGVAYEVTWRGLVGLGFFNCIKGDTAYTFCYSSPIVLDLNGDGVQTVDTAHGVQFDMSGDGHTQSVGWVDKHDALLVRDINHDGKINNGTELFGSDTVLKNGQKAGDGWGALADMDSNADGKIDAQDAAFADMQVWVDANGDGVTDAGELRGLIEAGIQSIDVTHANSNTSQNGNVLFGTGQFTKVDGTTAALTDAWFEVGRTLALDFTQVKGQALDMSDGQAQTVTLDFKELMAYTEVNGALQLSGDAADVVKIVNGGAAVTANRQDINGQVFNAYDLNLDGMNDLLLAQAMNQAQLF